MYNRYIPQPDGSWQKRERPDSPQTRGMSGRHLPEPAPPEHAPEVVACAPQISEDSCSGPVTAPSPTGDTVGGFLRHLLPGNFDTGDLLVILLLLLIAGDNSENRGTALLTLALYFFL